MIVTLQQVAWLIQQALYQNASRNWFDLCWLPNNGRYKKKKLNDFEESCKKNINIWLILATHWFKCNENDKPHHFIQDVFTYN